MFPRNSDNSIDEFLEAAQAASPYPKKGNNFWDEPSKPTSNSSSNDDKDYVGELVQYAKITGGFMPATSTQKTLTPGSYTLGMTPDGMIIYETQKNVTDDLMRLPDSKSDEVITEVETFWKLKDKYKSYGFAHKRGFLLWGIPGSGKTSCTAIIMEDMIKAGGVVFIGEHPLILAKGLKSYREIEPTRPLVVILEDIDTLIMRYGEAQILSILDGEAQVENVVFIATTNYPEKLDGRVINRPSRFDKIVKIGTPNAAARAMYISKRIGMTVYEDVDLVAETDGFSIAHIKELIIGVFCQGNRVTDTLARLKGMRKPVASDNSNGSLPMSMK